MPQTFDSIIFDLDGTLWDASGNAAEAWKTAISTLGLTGYNVSRQDIISVTGMKYDLIVGKLFPGLERDRQGQFLDTYTREELLLLKRSGGTLYEELEKVLAYLEQRFRLFIVSNCQSGYIEAFFDYHGLGKFFQDYECAGRTGKNKDENIRIIIERNNLSSPVFVGDTEGDCDASYVNNIPFVFASYGFGQVSRYDGKIDKLTDLYHFENMVGHIKKPGQGKRDKESGIGN